MKRRIAILFHEAERKFPLNYVITHFARLWHAEGNDVFYLFGVKQFVAADLVIVHVDLSVVPDEYLEFARQYPIVLNGEVKDIRKSTYSTLLLKPGDTYEGKVIVKSNLNYAGQPERARGVLPPLDKPGVPDTPTDDQATTAPVFRSPADYRIYDDLKEVPQAWFDEPDFVVEKFLPEMENGLYCLRHLHFLGDRMTGLRLTSPNPIVAGSTLTQTERIEPHPEIVELRKTMKFDYGKFDYVVHEGKAVLLDANKTVGAGTVGTTPMIAAGREYRAKGIYSYFEPTP
jgi:hypothetical protein